MFLYKQEIRDGNEGGAQSADVQPRPILFPQRSPASSSLCVNRSDLRCQHLRASLRRNGSAPPGTKVLKEQNSLSFVSGGGSLSSSEFSSWFSSWSSEEATDPVQSVCWREAEHHLTSEEDGGGVLLFSSFSSFTSFSSSTFLLVLYRNSTTDTFEIHHLEIFTSSFVTLGFDAPPTLLIRKIESPIVSAYLQGCGMYTGQRAGGRAAGLRIPAEFEPTL
ncbi:hypothetical protein FQA47_011572 [Oryzias melastigma]|uniref:Uncharacterized protein n=1 Tax=Oryzias melastigma TaxID=30732 RepID=A0A834FCC2_ORYME|nr:hypothetical protein FQA47_011572 [Oryzias melastigma]